LTLIASPVAAQGRPHLTGVNGLSAVLPALMNSAYGGYTTAIYVENVSHGGLPAHVSIQYFDSNGNVTGTGDSTPTLGIPFWGEWTVRQDNGNSFMPGVAGWGLVTSDQQVAVFVNEFAPGGMDGSSYTSIQMPAGSGTVLWAPTIVNNAYGGYTTGIGLNNPNASMTSATVTYSDQSGTPVKTQVVTLPAHGYAGLYSGDSTLALPMGFTGTATIVSSGVPLAGIVNEVGPGGQFSSYDAVSAGATTLYAAAALNNAYGGYTTGMGVQNTTGIAGNVTVNYYDSSGVSAGSVTKAIAANGYLGIYQGGTDGPPASAVGYTAAITGDVAIAAIVNETAPGGMQSTSYNGEPLGSGYLNVALVENAGSDGWSTGLGIVNTTNATISFLLTYFNADTGAFISQTSLSLPAHAYLGRYTPTDLPTAGTRASAWLFSTTLGLAAICNEQGAASLMSYNGQ
jgi:hypothetical protein